MQYKFSEHRIDNVLLSYNSNEDGLYYEHPHTQEIHELNDLLFQEVIKIIKTFCSYKRTIIFMYLKGHNQQEIADQIKISQSNVQRCLMGYDRTYKNKKTFHYKSLFEIIKEKSATNKKVQRLLSQIKELKEDV